MDGIGTVCGDERGGARGRAARPAPPRRLHLGLPHLEPASTHYGYGYGHGHGYGYG